MLFFVVVFLGGWVGGESKKEREREREMDGWYIVQLNGLTITMLWVNMIKVIIHSGLLRIFMNKK